MSTNKLDLEIQVSANPIAPLLVAAQAKTNHQLSQTAALTEGYMAQRSIQPPNRNLERQKQLLRFCPTCKMLLRNTTSAPSTLRCKKCGYKTTLDHVVVFDSKHSNQNYSEIAVIDQEKSSLRTHPLVQAVCEKCGKTESETWTVAVGSEGTVSAWVFLRCISCGFIKREVG